MWDNYWNYRKVWYRYICHIWPQGTGTNILWWQWCIHITENFTPSKDGSLELSDDRKRFHCFWLHYVVSQELWLLTHGEHALGRFNRLQTTWTSFSANVWREGSSRSKSSGKLYHVKWKVVTDTSHNSGLGAAHFFDHYTQKKALQSFEMSVPVSQLIQRHTKRPWSSETLLCETHFLLVHWRGFCWP